MILMIFWKQYYFGGKMGVAAMIMAPKGLGPREPTKKLAHSPLGGIFGLTVISIKLFKI